jgi:hypothetical protein
VRGRVHDDVMRPRENPGVAVLPVFLRHIGSYENIMDHEE